VLCNNIISCADGNSNYSPTDYPTTLSDPVFTNNLAWDNVDGSATDPKFINANGTNGLDFQIRAGSAADNTGVTIPIYNRDSINVPAFNDTSFGNPDKGAYERNVTAWTAGATTTGSSGATPSCSIAYDFSSGEVTINFIGIVQAAHELTGPWTNIVGATSPLVITNPQGKSFFRSRK